MSVDPVKMVPVIHKLSGLVSEVCIRHLFTLFVGYMCVKWGEGVQDVCKFVFACSFVKAFGSEACQCSGWSVDREYLLVKAMCS